MQFLVVIVGLVLAGWGHFLVHDLLGADASWRRLDDLFPAVLRSPGALAGRVLLGAGALMVLVAVVG